MNNNEALARIRARYIDDDAAVEGVSAFFAEGGDPEVCDPSVAYEIMIIVHNMPDMTTLTIDDVDATLFHELLTDIDQEFADLFADENELCREHSCDPEICAMDPEINCDGM